MADCEYQEKCIFYQKNMKKALATADMFKKRYCRGDSSLCARFIVRQTLGPLGVPTDLYPGDLERAKGILSSQ